MNCLNKILDAFNVDESQMLVAGVSMGAPATLFFSGRAGVFSHAAMLHGIRLNYDPANANDVENIMGGFEETPLGADRPKFWYSTSKNDWVTNYLFADAVIAAQYGITDPGTIAWLKNMLGFTLAHDESYIRNGDGEVAGYSDVFTKFDYGLASDTPTESHKVYPDEKQHLFDWFLLGVTP